MKKLIFFIFLIIISIISSAQIISDTKHNTILYVSDGVIKNKLNIKIATYTDSTISNYTGIEFVRILSNNDILDKNRGIVGKILNNKIIDQKGKILGYIHQEFGYVTDANKKIIMYLDESINQEIAILLIFFYPELG